MIPIEDCSYKKGIPWFRLLGVGSLLGVPCSDLSVALFVQELQGLGVVGDLGSALPL